jgi:hypothetical protein
MVPIPFDDLREPSTGKTKVRLVDTASEGFRVARAYMIRLDADDFVHAAWVESPRRGGAPVARRVPATLRVPRRDAAGSAS